MRPDPEIEQLKASVSCAVLLERLPPLWRLDRQESTRHCLKYRRGVGEVLIVNHEGRGWWDPRSDHKGDIFSLVQFLDPTLNFGRARQVLRRFAGLTPQFPAYPPRDRRVPDLSIQNRWAARPRLHSGSPAWRYLSRERGLPVLVLRAAIAADIVRCGYYGSAWFAHRAADGTVDHVEIRGPDFKGSLTGGRKSLFQLHGGANRPIRLALTEAPIDALSLAAWENLRSDTLYAASGGGMGPGTIEAIMAILTGLAGLAGAEFASAADADRAGERYAARHQALAHAAGVRFVRLTPPIPDGDWNDALRLRRAA